MGNWRTAKVLIGVPIALLASWLCLTDCVNNSSESSETILFLGNSITWSPPSPGRGWHGYWGMAASAREKDYAHRTVEILKATGNTFKMGIAKKYCYCDGPMEETLANIHLIRKYSPDYIVVQFGEHASGDDIFSGKLEKQYSRLLGELTRLNPKGIVCLSPWMDIFTSGQLSDILHRVSEQFSKTTFINTRPIYSDSTSFGDPALFSDPNVLWHPGDLGMELMAQKIATAILESRL